MFFRRYADYLVVNFPENYIKLFKGFPPDVNLNEFAKVSYLPQSGYFRSNLLLNNRLMKTIWDTGTNDSLVDRMNLLTMNSKACPEGLDGFSYCRYVDAGIVSEQGEQVGTSHFFVKRIFPVYGIDAVVGNTFFHDNLVVFDFKHHAVYVKNVRKTVFSPEERTPLSRNG